MKKIIFSFLSLVLIQTSYGLSPDEPGDKIDSWVHSLDMNPWKKYSESIIKCNSGTFTLINPLAISGAIMEMMFGKTSAITQNEFKQRIEQVSMTYQIMGFKENKCQVKMNIPANPDIPPPEGNPKSLSCNIPENSLFIVSKAAQTLANYSIKQAYFNGAADSESAKILNTACVQGIN